MNLEPEEVTSTTMKYLKTVQMLEKGLPPNDVVSMLKKKVEVMKQRVGVCFLFIRGVIPQLGLLHLDFLINT